MKNQECLYLCHMTKEEKKEYNKRYYQEHKDYWTEYYGRRMPVPTSSGVPDSVKNSIRNEIDRKASKKAGNELYARQKALEKLESISKRAAEVAKYREQDARRKDLSLKPFYEDIGIYPSYYRGISRGNDGSQIHWASPHSKTGWDEKNKTYMTNVTASQRTGQSYAGVMTKSMQKTALRSMTDTAIRKGKSIVKGFASFWKLGWK